MGENKSRPFGGKQKTRRSQGWRTLMVTQSTWKIEIVDRDRGLSVRVILQCQLRRMSLPHGVLYSLSENSKLSGFQKLKKSPLPYKPPEFHWVRSENTPLVVAFNFFSQTCFGNLIIAIASHNKCKKKAKERNVHTDIYINDCV